MKRCGTAVTKDRGGSRLFRFISGQLQAGIQHGGTIILTDDLWWSEDGGSAYVLVLLDLSTAFDAVNQDIFLDCLWRLGIGGTVLYGASLPFPGSVPVGVNSLGPFFVWGDALSPPL